MASGLRSSSSYSFTFMRDTRAWQLQVWISFGLAVFLCATGLAYLPGQTLDRAFMVMGYVFCLSTVFVLSKAVRDRHEADLLDGGLLAPVAAVPVQEQ